MSEFPDLQIFFLTVGEAVSFESLDALKLHTKQPYRLTIWYDTCGRGLDLEFYGKLLNYTDDVFVLSKNHGPTGALSYALLYLGGKYVMVVFADTVVREGYLDRFAFAFQNFEKICCAGSFRNINAPMDFLINCSDFMPDGVQIYSRKAINDVGGIAACFKGMGMENLEWQGRAMKKGWNVITCNKIMKEIGSTHDGREKNPNLSKEIEESDNTFLRIGEDMWKTFNWWDTSWAEKREAANV